MVELEAPVDMRVVQPAFVEQGIWVRPFGKLVYLMPPYVTSTAQIEKLTAGVRSVVERYA